MLEKSDISGLILAGGAGRRVEGRDKGLILWHNKPLVAHVTELLRPQLGKLVISCNRNRERYSTLADATVSDTRRDFQGPLAGLEAAIPLIDSEFLLLVACDTPSLPADLASRLLAPLRLIGSDAADISFAHDGEREQYLSAMIRTRCLDSLPAYLDKGGRAVHNWYHQHNSVAVNFSDQADAFANYNRLN